MNDLRGSKYTGKYLVKSIIKITTVISNRHKRATFTLDSGAQNFHLSMMRNIAMQHNHVAQSAQAVMRIFMLYIIQEPDSQFSIKLRI